MGVDHGGLDVLVPQKLLDGADVVTVFEEVGGKTVAEGVRGDGLVDMSEASGFFDRLLQSRFVHVVALLAPANGIDGEIGCRKDILPGELASCVRVFAFQSIREIDAPAAQTEIHLVLGFDLPEVEAQGLEQDVREHGEAVVLALPIADNDLVVGEVEILDAQAHDFHETEAAAIHDLGHNFEYPIQVSNDLFRLLAGENSGDALGPGWADGYESSVVQLNLQNIAVEKEDGADGLVLGGGGDSFLIDEVGDEGVDLVHAHLAGMALIMVEDVLAYPADVGLFGTEGVVAVTKEFAVLVEQFFALRSALRTGALRRTLRTSGFPSRGDI